MDVESKDDEVVSLNNSDTKCGGNGAVLVKPIFEGGGTRGKSGGEGDNGSWVQSDSLLFLLE